MKRPLSPVHETSPGLSILLVFFSNLPYAFLTSLLCQSFTGKGMTSLSLTKNVCGLQLKAVAEPGLKARLHESCCHLLGEHLRNRASNGRRTSLWNCLPMRVLVFVRVCRSTRVKKLPTTCSFYVPICSCGIMLSLIFCFRWVIGAVTKPPLYRAVSYEMFVSSN